MPGEEINITKYGSYFTNSEDPNQNKGVKSIRLLFKSSLIGSTLLFLGEIS